MYTRIKICGITRPADALAAAELGADAIGLVFAPGSPRRLDIEQAVEICRVVPPLLGRVGLFMDQPAAEIRAVLERVPLNWLQFHGREPAEDCRAFGLPYVKVVPMADPGQADYTAYPDAAALLLDGHGRGEAGGSGRRFDWSRAVLPGRPWILAGGLNPANVAEALALMNPPAVDVSSGVESAPGIKDDKLMKEFIQAIRNG